MLQTIPWSQLIERHAKHTGLAAGSEDLVNAVSSDQEDRLGTEKHTAGTDSGVETRSSSLNES